MSVEPLATVVITPRERHSCSYRAFCSLISCTSESNPIIYIDCATPAQIMHDIRDLAADRPVTFITQNQFSSPNSLRNLGAHHVKTKYVCFVDNDVIYKEGWLDSLVQEAEDSDATIVHPITLIGEFNDDRIHHAGGQIIIANDARGPHFHFKHILQDQSYSKHRLSLQPCLSDYAEFHCVLVRMEELRALNFLDEGLLSLFEHNDLCLQIKRSDGVIRFCPDSVVSYATPTRDNPVRLYDIDFYKKRWSYQRNHDSAVRFYEKWNYILADEKKGIQSSQLMCCHPFANRQFNRVIDLRSKGKANSLFAGYCARNLHEYPYAHTFPALAYQAYQSGLSIEDIERLRDAFDLAHSIHGRALRRCRLPFIDHCVGVASILLLHGADINLISAGLIHAIYLKALTAGPTGYIEASSENRLFVKEIVGESAETAAYAYSLRLFNNEVYWQQGPEMVEAYPVNLASVAIVRVANELEECLDLKVLFDKKLGGDNFTKKMSFLRSVSPLLDQCGYGELVQEALECLDTAYKSKPNGDQQSTASIPKYLIAAVCSEVQELRPHHGSKDSFHASLKSAVRSRLAKHPHAFLACKHSLNTLKKVKEFFG